MYKIIQAVIRISLEIALLVIAGLHSHWSVTTILTLQMLALEGATYLMNLQQDALREIVRVLEGLASTDRALVDAAINLRRRL